MNPVQKVSKSRKRKRRSHHALTPTHLVRCPQCGSSKRPHYACGQCGFHNANVAVADLVSAATGDDETR